MAALTGRPRRRLGALITLAVAGLLVACGPATTSSPSGGSDSTTPGATGFTGHATLGPVCPVVRPGDPGCADRPVAGATIHVLDASGTEIARLTTDATGGFGLSMPAGTYRLVADPIQGAMRAPAPIVVEVGNAIATVDLGYDTGIR